MSRQGEIDKIMDLTFEWRGNASDERSLGEVLVDLNIGTKDRFEIGHKYSPGCDMSDGFIKPIDYKDKQ